MKVLSCCCCCHALRAGKLSTFSTKSVAEANQKCLSRLRGERKAEIERSKRYKNCPSDASIVWWIAWLLVQLWLQFRAWTLSNIFEHITSLVFVWTQLNDCRLLLLLLLSLCAFLRVKLPPVDVALLSVTSLISFELICWPLSLSLFYAAPNFVVESNSNYQVRRSQNQISNQ